MRWNSASASDCSTDWVMASRMKAWGVLPACAAAVPRRAFKESLIRMVIMRGAIEMGQTSSKLGLPTHESRFLGRPSSQAPLMGCRQVPGFMLFWRAIHNMSIVKSLLMCTALALAGCALPSNVVNDLVNMGDPNYENCRRRGFDSLSFYGARCAMAADPKVIAAKAEQERQAAEQQRSEAEAEQQNLAARQNAELARGYSPITVQDFVLDGKELAVREAKRSLTGVYLPVGSLGLLFQSTVDAIQFSNGQNQNSPTVHLVTENASSRESPDERPPWPSRRYDSH